MNRPQLGDIVIYRQRETGIDVPAIVTGHTQHDDGAIHLHQFVPPGLAPDWVDQAWGVLPYPENPEEHEDTYGTWRPRPPADIEESNA